MLRSVTTAILCVLLQIMTFAQQTKWKTLHDKYGYVIKLPPGITDGGTTASGIHYYDDGEISVVTDALADNINLKTKLDEYYSTALGELNASVYTIISKQKEHEQYTIVKKDKEGSVYYEKSVTGNHSVFTLTLSVDANNIKHLSEADASNIVGSFAFDPLSGKREGAASIARPKKPVTYDTAILFNAARLKKGSYLFVHTPAHKPRNDVWRYKWVYTDLDQQFPGKSKVLQGTTKLFCTINNFISLPGNNAIYVVATSQQTGEKVYVDLKNAVLAHEVEVQEFPLEFVLFVKYIKGLKGITDNEAVGFVNTFIPPTQKLNEFDQKKLIASSRDNLENLRNEDMDLSDQNFVGIMRVGTYDFIKKGFPVQAATLGENSATIGLLASINFDMTLSDKIKKAGILFENIDPLMVLPFDEITAEQITRTYFTDSERRLYYMYNFDFTESKLNNVKTLDGGMIPGVTKMFMQGAKVSVIEIYTDASLTNKITTLKL